ncbi:hypothetical protein GE061_016191 [Apolygus lucorum]|uniref:isopentenyl-diphosphate Delta-isomerase n=1 Tax=Apolygus lucorum TaxID=248454 RepID=A0A8S9XFJ1_APOLU|nr:hypothetical protein GE061_016191 [Apolygus lucorum]
MNPVQEESMKETCILVDSTDKVVGKASKRECHLVGPNGEIPLHRAFSLFVFNSQHELLLQKRSSSKITFPDLVTNTCCSHPLYDWEDEREEEDAIGIKRAARRRLELELGIPKTMIDLKDIVYLTRILYKSTDDGVWGEHELDYILFIIGKDLPLRPNLEEVSWVRYLRREDFDSFMNDKSESFSPWFSLIAKNYLATWWDNLSRISEYQDHKSIKNFTK